MASAKFVLALALLAIAAGSAVSAPAACTQTLVPQAGTLKTMTPKGCLTEDATAGVSAKCFNTLLLNVTNSTGAGCAPGPMPFEVGFVESADCPGGAIGSGNMTAAKSGSTVKGEFITGNTFKGTSDPAGNFVVSVDGVKCELSYTVKAAGKPIPLPANATAANATEAELPAAAAAAPAESPEPAAAPAASPSPAPAKSAAAAALPSAVLALAAGALALAL